VIVAAGYTHLAPGMNDHGAMPLAIKVVLRIVAEIMQDIS
jgi:hypothetical protein